MKLFLAAGLAAALAAGPVGSNYETATGNKLSRDCGYSVVLRSGQALWLFCDTATLDAAGQVIGFIGGNTAGVGPVGGQLSELPTPPAVPSLPSNQGPQPFLPTPTGLVLPDGSPCGSGGGSYAASWISGAARGPARTISGFWGQDLVALTYSDMCVRGHLSWTTQAWGISFYHPASNRFVGHHRLFAAGASTDIPWQRRLGSPIFASDGNLYLYASQCDDAAFGSCGSGRTVLARTPWRSSTGWSRPGSYRYWTPSGWVLDPSAAVSVMPGARPFGVDVRSYPGIGLAAIEQTTIAGHYRIWRAASPSGPWTVGAERQLPACAAPLEGWCYAFIGHPEQSSGTQIALSYYDPTAQHVILTTVPLS